MAALAAALPTAHNDDDDADDMAALAAAAAPAADDLNEDDDDGASDDGGYEDDFVDPEDYTDDDFQSVDTADEEPDYDPKLPEVADAKLPVPRRPRRAAPAAALAPAPAPVPAPEPVPAPAPAPAVTNYDKWNNIGDEEQGPPPSPVDHAGALPAMRVSERDDGGISFDFTTMQPEANDDLVTLNPLGGDDVDENEKPGIYRRATPDEAPRPPPAPRVLGVCSSSTCSKDATLRCGVCKVAKYCSVICQRRDWKLHKAVCAPIRSEKAGRHLRTSAE